MNTIIEKIRAEVERRKKAIHSTLFNDEYNDFLSFLSDLEKEEKPTTAEGDVFKEWGTTEKDYLDKSMEKVHLEMEIATYLKDWEEDEEIGLHLSTDNGCIPIELDDVRDLARHFAKWQKEQIMKSPIVSIGNTASEELQRINYENGKKDMREQMMKDAVEGEIINAGYPTKIELNTFYSKFEHGQKVKLIIIKED